MKKIAVLLALMLAFFALTASAYSLTLYNGEKVHSTLSVTEGTAVQLPTPTNPEGERFMGWRTQDASKIYRGKQILDGETALYAFFDEPRKMTPGNNAIVNGNFENDELDVYVSNGIASFAKDGTGSVLYYVRGSHHASIQWPVTWEAGRKYFVSYKIKSEFSNMMTSHNYRYLTTETTGTGDHSNNEHYFDANTWHTVEYDYIIPENYVENDAIDALGEITGAVVSEDIVAEIFHNFCVGK